MRKTAKRWLVRALCLVGLPPLAFLAWLYLYSNAEIVIRPPLQFSLKQGSSLRSVARQMREAGALDTPVQFELLARLSGDSSRIQAGSYELSANITPAALLRRITSADHTQEQITIVEGWTFGQLRAVLDGHTGLRHDTRDLSETEIRAKLGISHALAEGLFFPDTYFFAVGGSDIAVLQRAYHAMQLQLDTLWNRRVAGLPLESSYQALILASIVERETGQPGERPVIAAVFLNRLRLGMKLQTDPTVIYGLGERFDGNLRKIDLLTDGPYNTYTRSGLPPTPIAMPGLAALTAVINPAPSNALYFVSRGDGTSHFSNTLTEHERAVTRYQRRGN